MIFKEIEWGLEKNPEHDYEEIPQEELWEDGEISNVEVQHKILHRVMQTGDWILIRRIDNGKK